MVLQIVERPSTTKHENKCLFARADVRSDVLLISERGGRAELQEEQTKATYLVLYRPGPAWLVGKSVDVHEVVVKSKGRYKSGHTDCGNENHCPCQHLTK